MEFLNKYFVEVCLKDYATFKGRVGRKPYWLFVGVLFALLTALLLLEECVFLSDTEVGEIFGCLVSVSASIVLLPLIAISVRRLHDVGKSGWWLLVPVYNIILLLGKSRGEA